MPFVKASDGVKLYYEEVGKGDPIIFMHEFGGSVLSWETQMRYFSRRYRCIAYQARGWPPSDVPPNATSYSQERAADDAADVIAGLNLGSAHLVGLSMGATAALEFAIRHPGKAKSISAAGAGTGSTTDPAIRKRFQAEATEVADRIDRDGIAALAAIYCKAPARQSLLAKDPRGFAEFKKQFEDGASTGRALTMRGVQARRAPFYDRVEDMSKIIDPVLIIAGDEDDATLDVSVFMKRHIPRCGLQIFPRTGHGINLEEPALFNAAVQDFIHAVEHGKWTAAQSVIGRQFAMLPKA